MVAISPEDIQWVVEDPWNISSRLCGTRSWDEYRGMGLDRGSGRGISIPNGHSRKDILPSQNGVGKKGLDNRQILHTDTLIKEVERLFGARPPDTLEVEKAKKVLKEHERALNDAISTLTDLSDGESDESGRQYSRRHSMG